MPQRARRARAPRPSCTAWLSAGVGGCVMIPLAVAGAVPLIIIFGGLGVLLAPLIALILLFGGGGGSADNYSGDNDTANQMLAVLQGDGKGELDTATVPSDLADPIQKAGEQCDAIGPIVIASQLEKASGFNSTLVGPGRDGYRAAEAGHLQQVRQGRRRQRQDAGDGQQGLDHGPGPLHVRSGGSGTDVARQRHGREVHRQERQHHQQRPGPRPGKLRDGDGRREGGQGRSPVERRPQLRPRHPRPVRQVPGHRRPALGRHPPGVTPTPTATPTN